MTLHVFSYRRGVKVCAHCAGPMVGLRRDAEVCSGSCRTERARNRRVNGFHPARAGRASEARKGVKDAKLALAARASRRPHVDASRIRGAVVDLVVLTAVPDTDLAAVAKLGGRIQKAARRLIARDLYFERYGRMP